MLRQLWNLSDTDPRIAKASMLIGSALVFLLIAGGARYLGWEQVRQTFNLAGIAGLIWATLVVLLNRRAP